MAVEKMYEMVLIFDTGLDDETVDEKVKRLEETITSSGGGVEDVTRWGKRKLAFPINKKESGTYVIFTFKSMSDRLEDIERGLKLDEEVLRYLIVLKDND